MIMECSYVFHPVGQGFFFTAEFQKNRPGNLNVVYDCGSLSDGMYLRNAIESYIPTLKKIKEKHVIDMLVISHFDEDHVNGVFDLLKNVKCELLVIPYMTVTERIAIFANGRQKADWHINLLRDPLTFFMNNGDFDIDRIIVVGGNEDISERVNNSEKSNAELPVGFAYSLPPKVANIETIVEFTTGNTKLPNIHFFAMPFALTLVDHWQFKFYNKKIDPTILASFEAAFARDFTTLQNKLDIFTDTNRKRLKILYKRIESDINISSLSLSVTPNKPEFLWFNHFEFERFDIKIGLLLTGDSALKAKRSIDDFCDYYSDELDKILIYQIPHHVSIYSSLLDPASRLMNFPIMLINSGAARKKHPHKKLKQFLIDNFKRVYYNTEFYRESVSFYILFDH